MCSATWFLFENLRWKPWHPNLDIVTVVILSQIAANTSAPPMQWKKATFNCNWQFERFAAKLSWQWPRCTKLSMTVAFAPCMVGNIGKRKNSRFRTIQKLIWTKCSVSEFTLLWSQYGPLRDRDIHYMLCCPVFPRQRGGVDLPFKGPLATPLEPQVQAWFGEPGCFDI